MSEELKPWMPKDIPAEVFTAARLVKNYFERIGIKQYVIFGLTPKDEWTPPPGYRLVPDVVVATSARHAGGPWFFIENGPYPDDADYWAEVRPLYAADKGES